MLFATSFTDDMCIGFFIFLIMLGIVIRKAVNVTKKVVTSDTAKEVGKGIFAAWLRSIFR